MTGLDPVIVLAHGSRHRLADEAVESLARAVQRLTGHPCHAAHLDFSDRTLTAAAEDCAAAGAERALVVPLLFTSAFHMKVDVPREIDQASQHTGLDLVLTEGLGTGDDLAEVIAAAHPEARGAESFVLYAVGSSVPGANEAVRGLAERVGRKLGAAHAAAVFATGASHATAGSPQPLVGPDAALSTITGRTGYIAPLFVSPGTLWDRLLERMPGQVEGSATTEPQSPPPADTVASGGQRRCIRAGTPLGDALAPLIGQRIAAADTPRPALRAS